eukprot:6209755-Pleurochrysis_carterae.AAC.1
MPSSHVVVASQDTLLLPSQALNSLLLTAAAKPCFRFCERRTGDQVKLKGPRLPSAIPGGGFQLIVAAEIVHFYSELRPSAAGELKCPTCEIVYIRLPTALYGTEQMRCAPSALMSKEHGVVQE